MAENSTNGYDGEELQRFIAAIDKEHDKLDKMKAAYMLECKGPRGRIKQTLKAARESDINMNAFREMLAKHLADRKHDKRLAEMEADDQEAYALIVDALGEYGETPLGKAALARIKPKGGETLDSLKQ